MFESLLLSTLYILSDCYEIIDIISPILWLKKLREVKETTLDHPISKLYGEKGEK